MIDIKELFPKQKILVIGDFIHDVYVYGKPSRLSREAPVLVLDYEREEFVPGGAGNSVNNLKSLGCSPRAIYGHNRILKTRFMAGDEHTSKQQIIRIDRVEQQEFDSKICSSLEIFSKDVDAIIVSDYGYGVVDDKVIGMINELAKKKRVVVDSRYQLNKFNGVTAITPNEDEFKRAIGIDDISDNDTFVEESYRLKKTLNIQALLITRGNKGMSLFEEKKFYDIPICGDNDITDVTGAGDTVTAVFTLALASGASFYESAILANKAAGIVVKKSGTATLTQDELIGAMCR